MRVDVGVDERGLVGGLERGDRDGVDCVEVDLFGFG